ncbi:MAG: SDR family NAD(P)-dependent oxidoreductase [Bryobacteraceae bacterium]
MFSRRSLFIRPRNGHIDPTVSRNDRPERNQGVHSGKPRCQKAENKSIPASGDGRTSGIGRAAANKLAQLDIHVIVVGRDAARAEKAVAEIRGAGGKADFISSDLRDASSARTVARRAVELGNGRVDRPNGSTATSNP